MTVETMIVPQDAVVANPAVGDDLAEGDDHLRGIKVMLKKMAWEHVGTITAAAAASVNTYSSIGTFVAGYDYRIVGDSVYGASATILRVRATVGGVVDSGANYHSTSVGVSNGASSVVQALSQTDARLGVVNVGNATGEAARFELTILNPMGTANPRHMYFSIGGIADGAASVFSYTGDAFFLSASAVDGLEIFFSAVNITGNFKLYRCFRPT